MASTAQELRENTPLLKRGGDGGPGEVISEQQPGTAGGTVNDYSRMKKYLKYLAAVIVLIILIEAAINYHKIMDRFQRYIVWVSLFEHMIIIGLISGGHTRRSNRLLLVISLWNHLFDSLNNSLSWSRIHFAHCL